MRHREAGTTEFVLTSDSVVRLCATRLDFPPLRVFRFSDQTLSAGIETHTIDGERKIIVKARAGVAAS